MTFGTEANDRKLECWHWPQCCTKDHCPVINSVAAYIKAAVAKGGIARIDTGYPYGDNAKNGGSEGGCPKDIVDDYMTSARFLRGTQLNATVDQPLHASCDTHGISLGIKQSGVSREKIFVSAKVGYAGPMGGTNAQINSIIKHMGVGYLDLCMVHFPEVGPGTGSHGEYNGQCPDKECHCVPTKSSYNAETCRYNTYKNMLDDMKAGHCKSVGVFGWTADQIDAVVKKGLKAPSVVQYKFHAWSFEAFLYHRIDLVCSPAKHADRLTMSCLHVI
jgi:diketogulonate reductase-like aldo/keto reductase